MISNKLVWAGLAALAAGAVPLSPAIAKPAEIAKSASSAAAPERIDFVKIDSGITLRRSVRHPAHAKGTVLLLHGFPETMLAWETVAADLGRDYEVHAFDWPGYGQSSRPAVESFGYTPRDYARVLREYIAKAHIDRRKLTIYATDIAGLPALLAALQEPKIARTIIVGDFAPFDRPRAMQERLQALKTPVTADAVRRQFNAGRDEILSNAMRRGLPPADQFEVSASYREDMAKGWDSGGMTSADAFYHYYSAFSRDQAVFEVGLARLVTPIRVVWGARDVYIDRAMGLEFAERIHAPLTILPGIGHYPHLQDPGRTAAEVRSSITTPAPSIRNRHGSRR